MFTKPNPVKQLQRHFTLLTVLGFAAVSANVASLAAGAAPELAPVLRKELIEKLSVEKRVRKDPPPVFLAATMADKSVPVENTLRLYQALRDAGVPAEMHVYAQGSHGKSLDPQYGPTALWPQRCEEWLRFNARQTV